MKNTLCGFLPLVASCGIAVEYVPLKSTNAPLHARAANEVEVFVTEKPQRPFTEIGIFESQQELYNSSSAEDIYYAMREAAGQRGCDALIVVGNNDATHVEGSVSRGSGFVSSRTLKGYRASCIVYSENRPTKE